LGWTCAWQSWGLVVFREAVTTKEAAGIDQSQLRQSAPAYPGGLYAREFEKAKHQLKVHVEGQLVFNATGQMI
jgi:hypothetical protein